MSAERALANLEAYERWAEDYPPHPHNPLMRAEQSAMVDLLPVVAGSRVLDLACGTGRYAKLVQTLGAAQVVALDFSNAMLRRFAGEGRVRASMMSLPFADGVFDVVVSGLAVGHAPQLKQWMSEAARVLKPGGALVYSDFHPAAAAAGMTRSFRDEQARKHTLLHRSYDVPAHRAAAANVGLAIDVVREIRVGVDIFEPFRDCEGFYRRWQGVPVVLVVRARKVAACSAA